ncbi:GNAT family N-acetyltransferase [Mycobacterium yunnanensis]|uniref:N-acetyltransferase Eis n=1 Tax=Mycobacterium yunnanensis TaxID=368477 RepID=A0A9X3C465_9MYCO|nr:GNAT family N-acetyltransferase [Mycobacterium yunnanensis]MCV7424056.1 GNAT family N-acetyltransferase [Mycobacterium yunnanensis]
MSADIRVLSDEPDLVAAANVFRAAMVGFRPLNGAEQERVGKLVEPGRTLGAFVDENLVATTDSAASTLTLPGGRRVAHAAVTHVGVLPSHTRRGIASDLLTRQLVELRNRGEAVATLRASEATIYERFGYGVASTSQTVEVLTARAALRAGVPPGDAVRLVDPTVAWDALPRIYDRTRAVRAGTIDRPAVWWENQRLRAEGDSAPRHVGLIGEPGAETGFVRYHPVGTDGWFTSGERTVVVDDLHAPTRRAYLGLLHFLLHLDLVDKLVFTSLPLDDPLPWLLNDRRAARVTGTRDETWLRVLDVRATLEARAFVGDGAVVLAVHDQILPDNSATFEISWRGVRSVVAVPQLTVGVAALGSLLLGGVRWGDLALAGLVDVHDTAALSAAEALFGSWPAPHAGMYF